MKPVEMLMKIADEYAEDFSSEPAVSRECLYSAIDDLVNAFERECDRRCRWPIVYRGCPGEKSFVDQMLNDRCDTCPLLRDINGICEEG